MRAGRAGVAALALAASLFVGARRIGPAPALGSFLEPAHGVWSLARSADRGRTASAAVPHLDASVTVLYDDRAVPHIFATTERDAYRALGYVTARDRLFQLYLQTMAASGRLTEIAGARALALDREMRGLGLPQTAERRAASAADTSEGVRRMRAYADGINAYLAQMPASELPLEFRLTGTKPSPWTLVDSYHLFNRMGWTLAYLAVEDDRAAAASRVGKRAAEALFPDADPIQEPIQPNGQRGPRFDFRPLPPPGPPDAGAARLLAAADVFLPTHARRSDDGTPPTMASNNWAVAPRRTEAGRALLSGDPHLDLTLPSIWYEAHLVVPGTLDVYGVTIPGSGAIIIGFNRDVAWTFTNTSTDVLDFYAEVTDDAVHPTRYRLDGAWRPVQKRVERYLGPGGAVVATDTFYFTHRGPMRRVADRWLSMRWTVLEAGTEINGFHAAAHARSVAELEAGFAQWYQAPAQNMLAADRGGHIAIRSTGRFPVRPGDGSGSAVRDGTSSASDWTGWVGVDQWPQAADPPQGYLASANQQPIDPRITSRWWGGSYDPWRALRINALLRADSAVTPDAMRRYQTDPGSARADLFVRAFLDAAQRRLGGGTSDSASASRLAEAAMLLGQWDRRYTRDNQRAVLFEGAMEELVSRTWDELTPPRSSRRVTTPSTAVLAELLADSSSVWWDDRATPRAERRDDILTQSLVAAVVKTRRQFGEPDAGGWRWDRIRHANVGHLLGLPSLSAREIPVQGGPGTLAPSAGSGTHSASWRMVVELGPTLRAWTTYPGGQSGNPLSPRYRDRIAQWARGELDTVRMPATPAQLEPAHRSSELHLHPAP